MLTTRHSSDGPAMVAVRLSRGVSPARAGGACTVLPCSPLVRSCDGTVREVTPVMMAVRRYGGVTLTPQYSARPTPSVSTAGGAGAILPCPPGPYTGQCRALAVRGTARSCDRGPGAPDRRGGRHRRHGPDRLRGRNDSERLGVTRIHRGAAAPPPICRRRAVGSRDRDRGPLRQAVTHSESYRVIPAAGERQADDRPCGREDGRRGRRPPIHASHSKSCLPTAHSALRRRAAACPTQIDSDRLAGMALWALRRRATACPTRPQ